MSAKQIATATVVVLAIVALAALGYLLLDILLLVFLGIVVAAALQPWHAKLCRWGVPKGAAVLLIYSLFLGALIALGILVAPVVADEISNFGASVPDQYARLRSTLAESQIGPIRLIAQRLPPFERLAQGLEGTSSSVFEALFGLTTTVVGVVAYLLSILAIAFYWTMELPRVERLVLSFVPVGRRTHALTMWHEIESKLGAFIRAQGIAMLVIGVASAAGYAAIGLPNVLVLGVLAGLLEAVPLVGPVLAALPAVLVALPLGMAEVLWVIGLATLLQVVENNVLMPRLMRQAVGVSSLVSLVAVIAFGTLYGVLGVFLAIPLMAVIQVLLDRMLINVEPVAEVATGPGTSPWEELGARVRDLRQQVRARLRARDTRMGIDPSSADHVVDARDQQIEGAVERVEKMISVAEDSGAAMAPAEHAALVERIQDAAQDIERAGGDAGESSVTAAREPAEPRDTTIEVPLASLSAVSNEVGGGVERVEQVITTTRDSPGPIEGAERTTIVERLDEATRQIKGAVEDVDSLVAAARAPSGGSASEEPEHTDEHHDEPAAGDMASTTRTRPHAERS
jgi:predicted PurR-regulated permease PerM